MSDQHREALAHLIYGIDADGGFIMLTGEVGTGKTTVCRCLLQQIPDDTDVAFILNPKLTVTELLATICDELSISYAAEGTIKHLVDRLNEHLLDAYARNRKTVLIIDEAQNLSVDVLEQLRLLTNLETDKRKLLQIILLGQPELQTLLHKNELKQLSQRITARFHLGALNQTEVQQYIAHRLAVAGAKGTLFPPVCVNRIYRSSHGIPRLINLICDRSLLGCYARNLTVVDVAVVDQAVHEVLGPTKKTNLTMRSILLATTIAASGAALAWILQNTGNGGIDSRTEPPIQLNSIAQERPSLPAVSDDNLAKPKDEDAGVDSPEPEISVAPKTVPSTQKGNGPAAGQLSAGIQAKSTGSNSSLSELLATASNTSRRFAFAQLYSLWRITYETDGQRGPCDSAPQNGLSCLTRVGSLRDLAHLDRPAVLRLRGKNVTTDHFVTLVSLSSDSISLQLDNQSYQIARDDLLQHWTGEYTLLWKTPPDYRGSVRIGSRGSDVQWLIQQLSHIQGIPIPSADELIYDEEIMEQVKKLQLSAGLKPDGIVGTNTWIKLNSKSTLNVPTITQRDS